MSPTAKLSASFRISTPEALCTARNRHAGLEFAFVPKGAGVLLVPVPTRESPAGIAKGASPADYRDRKHRS